MPTSRRTARAARPGWRARRTAGWVGRWSARRGGSPRNRAARCHFRQRPVGLVAYARQTDRSPPGVARKRSSRLPTSPPYAEPADPAEPARAGGRCPLARAYFSGPLGDDLGALVDVGVVEGPQRVEHLV